MTLNRLRAILVLLASAFVLVAPMTVAGPDPSPPGNSGPPSSSVSGTYPSVADSELASVFAGWVRRDPKVQPEKVMSALPLRPGEVVADLGAGHGYFSWRLGKAVGPTGKVLALDVSDKYLAVNRRVADAFSVNNIENRVVPPDDPQLKPGEVDLVFISYTWQFLDDRIHYAELLRSSLKSDGLLVVLGLEIPGVSHEKSDKPYRWTNRQEVLREVEAAGFSIASDNRSIPNQFFLLFRPGRSPIFDQIPGFTYVTSNLAMGDAAPDSAALELLRSRGFRRVLNLRSSRVVREPPPFDARMRLTHLSPNQPAAADSLATILNDADFGITYAFGDSLPQVAICILSACKPGGYRMSSFEFDHLVNIAHPIKR